MAKGRGRPPGQMTTRRRQVLAEYQRQIQEGARVRIAEVVRRCGLYDRSAAKRILKDLEQMECIR